MVFRATKWYKEPNIQGFFSCGVACILLIPFHAAQLARDQIAIFTIFGIWAVFAALRSIREIEVTPEVLRIRRWPKGLELTKNDIKQLQIEVAGNHSRISVATSEGIQLKIALVTFEHPDSVIQSLHEWVTFEPKFGIYGGKRNRIGLWPFVVFSLCILIAGYGQPDWPFVTLGVYLGFLISSLASDRGGIKADVEPAGLTFRAKGISYSVRWDELSQVKLLSTWGILNVENATISEGDRTWRLRQFGNYLDLRDTILANVPAGIVVDNRQI
ncbi:MAG: hypothetical protein JST51_00170 [Armatimonadetes bacterium]|nr:hypothetical protein [Armatimonadota bacterium]